jgi:hypothetical protein
MTDSAAAAEAYAPIGAYVFPVDGKTPLVKWGAESTTDIVKIREWWTRWPDAGVGIDTGKSRLIVIDLDVKNGENGPGNWKQHARGHQLPVTFHVHTPSGGWHTWYRDPDGKYRSSAGVIAPGVDVRGVGGFVVAPGSRGYTWHAEQPLSLDDIPVMPDGIIPVSVNGTHAGHWEWLDRNKLDPRDLAALEALEALGGHGAYRSGGYVAVTRPGKTAGASASVGHIGPGIVRVFTPNWSPMADGTVYDADQLRDLIPKPVPELPPGEGARLLDDVEVFLARFVAFPSGAALVAVTLWTTHTHSVPAFDSTPRLALLSPEPWSGKTRTLEILDLLVPRPMFVLNASTAVTFRAVDNEQPTLLLDEVDALFGRRTKDENEDLRGLLNAGHRKGATVPRCDGPTHALRRFKVYAACALAGLGQLPETIMSRSVVIRMRRRAPGERIESYRGRVHRAQGHQLRERLAEWSASVADTLANAWPEMPPGVEDRPADVWEPLLAITDAAGGDWPRRAREACVELLQANVSAEASLGVRLLGDLRDVFDKAGNPDGLHTRTILTKLEAMDEAPWRDLRGKPLDSRRLARVLGDYGVTSTSVRVGDSTLKGYRRVDLHDPWNRYLPPLPQEGLQGSQGLHARSEAQFDATPRPECDLHEGHTDRERHRKTTP